VIIHLLVNVKTSGSRSIEDGDSCAPEKTTTQRIGRPECFSYMAFGGSGRSGYLDCAFLIVGVECFLGRLNLDDIVFQHDVFHQLLALDYPIDIFVLLSLLKS
jgi:hypothetical protein